MSICHRVSQSIDLAIIAMGGDGSTSAWKIRVIKKGRDTLRVEKLKSGMLN